MVMAVIFKARTVREYINLAGEMRKSTDFLEYFKDDIHWFTFIITKLLIYPFLFFNRYSGNKNETFTFTKGFG